MTLLDSSNDVVDFFGVFWENKLNAPVMLKIDTQTTAHRILIVSCASSVTVLLADTGRREVIRLLWKGHCCAGISNPIASVCD